jgi:hypothetical protein
MWLAAFTALNLFWLGAFFMSMEKDKPTDTKTSLSNYQGDATALVAMLDRRIGESQDHWNKEFKLETVTKKNNQAYIGERGTDAEGNNEQSPDNRIFSSVRTIVPYVTSRITEPVVFPSSNSEASKRFAEDLEKALYIHADNEKLKAKVKFALEDAIIRRRGYLKPRYDAVTGNFCAIDYVPCESIIVDHKAKPYEEPRYYRHLLEKSVEDLLTMFPEMKEQIYEAFHCDETSTPDKLQEEHTINEDWAFVPDPEEGLDLIVCWNYKQMPLGTMKDPNWRYGQPNFLKHHTMPLVFFNVLSDGRTMIDKTSFVEQADTPQKTVDERSDQISKNAGLGNIGMPVVDSAALADDQSQYLTFEPDTVLELDVTNAGKNSINDVFTTWKAGTLSPDVYKDKGDAIRAVDDAFGVNSITRGNESNNKTAAQDVLLRDQSFGRQQEVVDAIDNAMSRLYPLVAQFLLVYGGQPSDDGNDYELFDFVGEDSEFDYVMINTQELDTKVKIRVKSGTSMPIDRPQRRATADKAAERMMIDPLTYWEIMDEANAQKYAKRLMEYKADPAAFMKETEDAVFNRDAFVDIQTIKDGGQPQFREDLPKEYFDHLNKYVLSGDLESPDIDIATKQAISAFIDAQLLRGQQMLGMAETQLPTPEDVNLANQQTDQLNQQDQQSATEEAKLQPKPTKQPVPQTA